MRNVFYIDLMNISSRDEFHDLLEKELPLPEYYGRNLDALADVLSESGQGWDIIFYNSAFFEEAEKSYFKKLQKLCSHMMEEISDMRIRFYR